MPIHDFRSETSYSYAAHHHAQHPSKLLNSVEDFRRHRNDTSVAEAQQPSLPPQETPVRVRAWNPYAVEVLPVRFFPHEQFPDTINAGWTCDPQPDDDERAAEAIRATHEATMGGFALSFTAAALWSDDAPLLPPPPQQQQPRVAALPPAGPLTPERWRAWLAAKDNVAVLHDCHEGTCNVVMRAMTERLRSISARLFADGDREYAAERGAADHELGNTPEDSVFAVRVSHTTCVKHYALPVRLNDRVAIGTWVVVSAGATSITQSIGHAPETPEAPRPPRGGLMRCRHLGMVEAIIPLERVGEATRGTALMFPVLRVATDAEVSFRLGPQLWVERKLKAWLGAHQTLNTHFAAAISDMPVLHCELYSDVRKALFVLKSYNSETRISSMLPSIFNVLRCRVWINYTSSAVRPISAGASCNFLQFADKYAEHV